MKKSKRFCHPISLSKQSSLIRKPKNFSAVPSPRNSKQKISFIVNSPKKDNDSFLLKQKFIHKNKDLNSNSTYLSFINPNSICSLKKKQSFQHNLSAKSHLLLSSIDMYANKKDRTINNYRDISKQDNNNVSQNGWTSRKNSLEKSLNINNISNISNNPFHSKTNRPYVDKNKYILRYSKDQLKEMFFKQFVNLKKGSKYKNNYNKHNCSYRVSSSKKHTNNNLSSSPNTNNNSSLSHAKYFNHSLLNYHNNKNYISIKNILNNKILNKSNSVYDNTKQMYINQQQNQPYTVNNSYVLYKRESDSSRRTNNKKVHSAKNSFSNLQDFNNIKLKPKKKISSAKPPNNQANTSRIIYTHKDLQEKNEIMLNLNINNNDNIGNNNITNNKEQFIFYKPKRENQITSLILKNSQNNCVYNPNYNNSFRQKINCSLNNDSFLFKHSKSIYIQRIPTNPILSTLSSSNNDNNYYLGQSNRLVQYVKKYYSFYKSYPLTTLNFYKYGRLIGQGAFGKVNLGLNILTGRVVAVKSFNKKNLNSSKDNKEKIIYETNLMKNLNHPSIVKVLEMFEDDKYMLIIMEYLNGGNLYSFVKKRRKLREKTAKFLFWQIIQGIKYLHSVGVVHRDIKLENILIDLNNKIKICDFGIGKKIKPYKDKKSEFILYDQCGTPMYIAPEILLATKEKGYNAYPVDMWSSGIALYIMLSGTLPFNIENKHSNKEENNIELQYSIIHNEPKPIDNISKEAKHLLQGLLNKNPKKRFTPDDVLNHPWFKAENFLLNPSKYHLFTKAEISIMNKTYIDYRFAKIEDIKECFTTSNLKGNESNGIGKEKKDNNESKSFILAPYNTRNCLMMDDTQSDISLTASYDNIENAGLIVNNNLIAFSNKVKEFNLHYELNNNGEVDNGILINTKLDTSSSVQSTTQQLLQHGMGNANNSETFYVSENGNDAQRRENLMEKMPKFGYDKEYVRNCLDNNELNHATAVFYLLENYDHIE